MRTLKRWCILLMPVAIAAYRHVGCKRVGPGTLLDNVTRSPVMGRNLSLSACAITCACTPHFGELYADYFFFKHQDECSCFYGTPATQNCYVDVSSAISIVEQACGSSECTPGCPCDASSTLSCGGRSDFIADLYSVEPRPSNCPEALQSLGSATCVAGTCESFVDDMGVQSTSCPDGQVPTPTQISRRPSPLQCGEGASVPRCDRTHCCTTMRKAYDGGCYSTTPFSHRFLVPEDLPDLPACLRECEKHPPSICRAASYYETPYQAFCELFSVEPDAGGNKVGECYVVHSSENVETSFTLRPPVLVAVCVMMACICIVMPITLIEVCYDRKQARARAAKETSRLRKDGSLLIYNDGEPAPPGWSTAKEMTACWCCVVVPEGPSVAGLPEGTPRVPDADAALMIARWQGKWQLKLLSSAPVVFADVSFLDNRIVFSGGTHIEKQVFRHDDGPSQHIRTTVRNAPQEQQLALFRGADGTLYLDNIGSRLVSETSTELCIRNGFGVEMILSRDTIQSPKSDTLSVDGPSPSAIQVASVVQDVAISTAGSES